MSECCFWVVTPSFNSLRWLPCAVASVADQAGKGIRVHHHVQDGGSGDGTREWLETYARQLPAKEGYTFSYESAPDRGMYDAINKGWALAPEEADFLGHLNSDEQYLPGALLAVAQTYQARPATDLILGDALVVDAKGGYICHQTSLKPWPWTSRYLCLVLTCTAFYRRRLLFETGVRFDPTWRALGDVAFYHHLFQHPVRVELCNRATSVFVDSGENLALGPNVWDERKRFRKEYGTRLSPLARWFQKAHTLRRLWRDWRRGLSHDYKIYLPDSVFQRTSFQIACPTSLWRRKFKIKPGSKS